MFNFKISDRFACAWSKKKKLRSLLSKAGCADFSIVKRKYSALRVLFARRTSWFINNRSGKINEIRPTRRMLAYYMLRKISRICSTSSARAWTKNYPIADSDMPSIRTIRENPGQAHPVSKIGKFIIYIYMHINISSQTQITEFLQQKTGLWRENCTYYTSIYVSAFRRSPQVFSFSFCFFLFVFPLCETSRMLRSANTCERSQRESCRWTTWMAWMMRLPIYFYHHLHCTRDPDLSCEPAELMKWSPRDHRSADDMG